MQAPPTPTPRAVVTQLWARGGASLLLTSVLIGLLVLAPTWYMQEVYDRVVGSRNVATLGMLTLGVVLLIGLLELLEWHRSEILRDAAQVLDEQLAAPLGAQAFGRVLRQGAAAGQQALGALQSLREFLLSPALTGLLDAPMALLFLGLLWLLHPVLAAVALGAAMLQLMVAWMQDRQCAGPQREGAQAAATAQAMAERLFDQAAVVQALDMQPAVSALWARHQQQADASQLRAARQRAGFQAASRWLQQGVGSALLGVACWLMLAGELPGGGGMLIVASLLGGRVVAPLVQLILHGAALAQTRKAWKTLCELLPDDEAPAPAMSLPPPSGRLTVEQLVITPAGPATAHRAPLLRGLGFRLEPGETLVVLGPSGAGKSTLARALVGLQAPSSGSVRLDGVEVSGWTHDALGRHLGYLPQQVALLDGSLADNVCRFGGDDMTALHQALNDAGMLTYAQNLPAGLYTALGEGGAWLSGGWRQRVGLARALYGRPSFVVLDEPNASLDTAGDAALEQALRSLKARGATVVVMSHRANVVQLADRLLVLRDGQQLAFGPKDEVLAALRQAAAPATDTPASRPAHAHAHARTATARDAVLQTQVLT